MEVSTAPPTSSGRHQEGGEPASAESGPPAAVRRTATGEPGRVLVLNASYEPLNVCTVRRAVVLVLKEKAEVVEHGDRRMRSESFTLPRPLVIRLVSYVRVPRRGSGRRITRRAVFARDSWTCQYCGTTAHLTVDHVIPRSRGGPSTWDNIVTSCAPCNRRKGSGTPKETGMQLRTRPRPPGPTVFIRVAAPVVPSAWQPYLVTTG